MYDLIIVGGGPAGITAGIYAARHNLKILILTKEWGGWIAKTSIVENYPGFSKIDGLDLVEKYKEHLNFLKVPSKEEEVISIKKEKEIFKIKTNESEYQSKTVFLAYGTKHRKLKIPGEEKFMGKGVSHCATCDAAFFGGKEVAVIGGSDSAMGTALLLAEYAKKVYLIYRKDKLRGEPINIDLIKKEKKIEVIYNTNITEIIGNKFVEKVKTDTGKEINLNGVFIEIGSEPNSEIIKELDLKLDENNYILTDELMKTNIKGVYAGGDIRNTIMRQIITACADGAIAAREIYKELLKG